MQEKRERFAKRHNNNNLLSIQNHTKTKHTVHLKKKEKNETGSLLAVVRT